MDCQDYSKFQTCPTQHQTYVLMISIKTRMCSSPVTCLTYFLARTKDTQKRHKSKKSENFSRCGRQNMLWPYLKIWEWEWIFGRSVKAISSLGVCTPCFLVLQRQNGVLACMKSHQDNNSFLILIFSKLDKYYIILKCLNVSREIIF